MLPIRVIKFVSLKICMHLKDNRYRYRKQSVVRNKHGKMEAYASFYMKYLNLHQTGVSIETIACQQ
jgi:hypothetical protein